MSSSRDSGRDPERRLNRRFQVGVTVKIWRDDTTLEARSNNISVGGMKLEFVDAQVPFEVGEHVDLEFCLPVIGDPVVTRGEIRWVTSKACGVQFTALHARVVSAINRLQSGR